jgi:hypothetical protein
MDPNIVIDDPTYRRHTTPPGATEPITGQSVGNTSSSSNTHDGGSNDREPDSPSAYRRPWIEHAPDSDFTRAKMQRGLSVSAGVLMEEVREEEEAAVEDESRRRQQPQQEAVEEETRRRQQPQQETAEEVRHPDAHGEARQAPEAPPPVIDTPPLQPLPPPPPPPPPLQTGGVMRRPSQREPSAQRTPSLAVVPEHALEDELDDTRSLEGFRLQDDSQANDADDDDDESWARDSHVSWGGGGGGRGRSLSQGTTGGFEPQGQTPPAHSQEPQIVVSQPQSGSWANVGDSQQQQTPPSWANLDSQPSWSNLGSQPSWTNIDSQPSWSDEHHHSEQQQQQQQQPSWSDYHNNTSLQGSAPAWLTPGGRALQIPDDVQSYDGSSMHSREDRDHDVDLENLDYGPHDDDDGEYSRHYDAHDARDAHDSPPLPQSYSPPTFAQLDYAAPSHPPHRAPARSLPSSPALRPSPLGTAPPQTSQTLEDWEQSNRTPRRSKTFDVLSMTTPSSSNDPASAASSSSPSKRRWPRPRTNSLGFDPRKLFGKRAGPRRVGTHETLPKVTESEDEDAEAAPPRSVPPVSGGGTPFSLRRSSSVASQGGRSTRAPSFSSLRDGEFGAAPRSSSLSRDPLSPSEPAFPRLKRAATEGLPSFGGSPRNNGDSAAFMADLVVTDPVAVAEEVEQEFLPEDATPAGGTDEGGASAASQPPPPTRRRSSVASFLRGGERRASTSTATILAEKKSNASSLRTFFKVKSREGDKDPDKDDGDADKENVDVENAVEDTIEDDAAAARSSNSSNNRFFGRAGILGAGAGPAGAGPAPHLPNATTTTTTTEAVDEAAGETTARSLAVPLPPSEPNSPRMAPLSRLSSSGSFLSRFSSDRRSSGGADDNSTSRRLSADQASIAPSADFSVASTAAGSSTSSSAAAAPRRASDSTKTEDAVRKFWPQLSELGFWGQSMDPAYAMHHGGFFKAGGDGAGGSGGGFGAVEGGSDRTAAFERAVMRQIMELQRAEEEAQQKETDKGKEREVVVSLAQTAQPRPLPQPPKPEAPPQDAFNRFGDLGPILTKRGGRQQEEPAGEAPRLPVIRGGFGKKKAAAEMPVAKVPKTLEIVEGAEPPKVLEIVEPLNKVVELAEPPRALEIVGPPRKVAEIVEPPKDISRKDPETAVEPAKEAVEVYAPSRNGLAIVEPPKPNTEIVDPPRTIVSTPRGQGEDPLVQQMSLWLAQDASVPFFANDLAGAFEARNRHQPVVPAVAVEEEEERHDEPSSDRDADISHYDTPHAADALSVSSIDSDDDDDLADEDDDNHGIARRSSPTSSAAAAAAAAATALAAALPNTHSASLADTVAQALGLALPESSREASDNDDNDDGEQSREETKDRQGADSLCDDGDDDEADGGADDDDADADDADKPHEDKNEDSLADSSRGSFRDVFDNDDIHDNDNGNANNTSVADIALVPQTETIADDDSPLNLPSAATSADDTLRLEHVSRPLRDS